MRGLPVNHLGGYIPGGDPATYYPKLWSWLAVGELGIQSVLDVGCGDGQAVRYFRDLGCLVLGVEGVHQDDPSITEHDYEDGPFVPDETFDLCWSCEFVEHVEAEFVPNFVETFQHADLLLLTHADPGQFGHHHVNCQTRCYWIETLEAAGFQYDDDLTRLTRSLASVNEHELNHYRRSGLAFRNG